MTPEQEKAIRALEQGADWAAWLREAEERHVAEQAALRARGFKVGDIVVFMRWGKARRSEVSAVGPKRIEVRYNTDAERAYAKRVGFRLVPHVIRIPLDDATIVKTVEGRVGQSIARMAGGPK